MSANMNDINAVLRQYVKRTPEMPEDNQWVLVWIGESWMEVKYWADDCWYDHGDCIDIEDGQYWMPCPTFDPSEVSCKD